MNAIPYGFFDLQSKFGDRVGTTVTVPEINTAVEKSIEFHSNQFNLVMALLCQRVTTPTLRYNTPGGGESQPGDENGKYLPTQGGSSYDVAFPIQQSGNAMGYNRVTGAKLTVEQVSARTAAIIKGDQKWCYKRAIAAMLCNTSWQFIDKEAGTLTIQPMANNDATRYYIEGTDDNAIHNHYYAQNAAISDGANPFPTIDDSLSHHAENSGGTIAFVSTSLVPSIQGLTGFVGVGDPKIQQGVNTAQLLGSPTRPIPGTLIGRVDDTWIVKWRELDAGYGFAITENGVPPIGMREHAEAELQGFKKVASTESFPFTEFQFERFAGFGAYSRLSAIPFQIGAANYTPPTRFASLPIA